MDKQEYLALTFEKLAALVGDRGFNIEMSQLRARAIRAELLREGPEVRFTFDPQRLWRLNSFILSECSLLMKENVGDQKILLEWVRRVAEAFEFLSRFSTEDERGFLLIGSALAYHIAGYQANAQCIAKRLESDYKNIELPPDSPFDAVLIDLFRRSLISFLKRHIKGLMLSSHEGLSGISAIQEPLIREFSRGTQPLDSLYVLTAHAYYQEAISNFIAFCLQGESERYLQGNTNLQKCYEYFRDLSDATLSGIVLETLTAFDQFQERSTWFTIRNYASDLLAKPVWNYYLRNLALDKSIVEFWASQLTSIKKGILTSKDSFVVQMPTSAGKTLVAELAILSALTSQDNARCLYLAPYRALVNEVENNLAETLGAVGYRISNLLGGFEFDALQDYLVRESDVLVTTPEKIDLFLRTHPEYFSNISVVIMDEGHIVGDGLSLPDSNYDEEKKSDYLSQEGSLGRGTLLEFLIARFKRRLPDVRFIFLSAVMPEINAEDFIKWLSKGQGSLLNISPHERPSRQTVAKFEWINTQNGELEYISLPRLPDGRWPFVPYFIQRTQYYTGGFTPGGRLQRRSWPDIHNKSQTVASLAVQFSTAGPVLVFCATKDDVRTVTRNIITFLNYLQASEKLENAKLTYTESPNSESYQLALNWLGEAHVLTQALHYRVALHFGPLPDPVREAIEDEFKNGNIQILVSTNTLGQGVNLPVKTAVIYSLERTWTVEDPETGEAVVRHSYVPKRDFWNICGRAGRAGKETEGQVIFPVITDHDDEFLNDYNNPENLEEVDSALFKILQLLVDKRIDQNDLLGLLDSHILALIAEEVVDTQDETAIAEYLGTSLVGVQAFRKGVDISPLVSAIKFSAQWINEQIQDPLLIKAFASTGLSVQSCVAIDESVRAFVNQLGGKIPDEEYTRLDYNPELLRIAFQACQNLREFALSSTIDYYGPENEYELILAWVNTDPIWELRTSYWDHSQGEAFSEYLSDRFIYRLPWGLNGFLRLLSLRFGITYDDLPVSWQSLSSMVKYGVGNVHACWAASLGSPTRSLSIQLANYYSSLITSRNSFAAFVKWFASLPGEFVRYELEASSFEKSRLINKIRRITPDNEIYRLIMAERKEIVSPIRGIPYEERAEYASQVVQGELLLLEPEPDNIYDPNAIKIIYRDHQIGYVQSDVAKIVAREILAGTQVSAIARSVTAPSETYPYPWIEMVIRFGDWDEI
jgi:helicase